jgi:predicted Zn-dependent protease
MLSTQAEVALSQRNQAGAIDLWRNAVALAPRDVTIRLRLADTLITANRHEEAAAELQQMISLNAGPDAHRRLANVYDLLGRGGDSAREQRLYTEGRLRQLQERSGDIR